MKERITQLSRAAYKIMPWKNGAGSTTELFIAPEGASLQSGFDWRISLARVPDSGPFSSFPGYQRTIVLLRGDPLRLVHQGHGEHLLRALEPYDFHGAWSTEGFLQGEAVDDFNVMVRDGFGHAQVRVQKGLQSLMHPAADGEIHFVHCHQGQVTVVIGNEEKVLREEESLLIEDHGKPLFQAVSTSTVALIVSIKRSSCD